MESAKQENDLISSSSALTAAATRSHRARIGMVVGGVAMAAAAVAIIFWDQAPAKPAPLTLAVPSGDREVVWLNTTTSGATWEHFVAGIVRAAQATPGLNLDDTQAYPERTTSVPEVVLSWKDRPGKLRVRWYKQTSEAGFRQWIDALAARESPPLAIIGGGSSDRARDLARELNERTEWKGPRPLLLITTATANEVTIDRNWTSVKLTQVYPDRTFRFCFTNEQMARAVIDFIWHMPDLKPHGGQANTKGDEPPPVVFPMQWEDDPYSIDLSEKFRQAVKAKTNGHYSAPFISHPPYSVGTFDRVNRVEEEYAQFILAEPLTQPGQQSLLILPTSTTPARRFLRALAGQSPLVGKQLVAVNGDAISFNDVYRDGAMLWNIRDVPIPIVFFAHQNPIGWDEHLPPPAATDEVLLFADLVRILAVSAFSDQENLAGDADELAGRLRRQTLIRFDGDGNRQDGSEFVVCVRPEITEMGHINARASVEVWNRLRGGAWRQIGSPEHPLRAPYTSRPLHLLGEGT